MDASITLAACVSIRPIEIQIEIDPAIRDFDLDFDLDFDHSSTFSRSFGNTVNRIVHRTKKILTRTTSGSRVESNECSGDAASVAWN